MIVTSRIVWLGGDSVEGLAETPLITGGVVSTFVIVPVALDGEPTRYPVPAVTVNCTVSGPSIAQSLSGVTLTAAVELPTPKVTVPVGGVKVVAPV